MVNCIIAEDEELAAKRLSRILKEVDPTIRILEVFQTVAETVVYLRQNKEQLDLLFLDIHLADGKSFEIFNEVDIDIPIIFTTAYNQYAIQAFKQNSVDNLLKPIQKDDLSESISKFKKIFLQKEDLKIDYIQLLEALKPEKKQLKSRFMVQVGDKIRTINTADIELFYAENKTCFIITKEGKRYYVNYTLDKLSGLLSNESFFRINRKLIANINSIIETVPYSQSKLKVILKNTPGFDVFVPAERITAFKKWLNN